MISIQRVETNLVTKEASQPHKTVMATTVATGRPLSVTAWPVNELSEAMDIVIDTVASIRERILYPLVASPCGIDGSLNG